MKKLQAFFYYHNFMDYMEKLRHFAVGATLVVFCAFIFSVFNANSKVTKSQIKVGSVYQICYNCDSQNRKCV